MQQSFCQKEHPKESPEDFVLRRAILSHMLNYATPGSKEGANLILKNVPVQWRTVLAVDSIKDTATLQLRVTEHKEALSYSASGGTSGRQYATLEDLQAIKNSLSKLGVRSMPPRRTFFSLPRPSGIAAACTAELELEEVSEFVEGNNKINTEILTTGTSPNQIDNHEAMITKAFVTLKQSQPAVPKEGYLCPKQDQIVSLLDRKPQWPCRACGSANHWDKECPHYNLFTQLQSKLAKSVYKGTDRPSDIKNVYRSAYQALLMQTVSQLYTCSPVCEEQLTAKEILLAAQTTEGKGGSPHSTSKIGAGGGPVSIEEEEDKYWQWYHGMTKAPNGVLLMEAPPDLEEMVKETSSGESVPDVKTIRLTPQRVRPGGRAAEGVSVVSVKGTIGLNDGDVLDLRLDSSADMTLISEELYSSMKNPPQLRQGMKLKLYQLMDSDAELLSFSGNLATWENLSQKHTPRWPRCISSTTDWKTIKNRLVSTSGPSKSTPHCPIGLQDILDISVFWTLSHVVYDCR